MSANGQMVAEAVEYPVEVEFDTHVGNVDNTGLDVWELQAARRSLLNLKTLLHGQKMLDLIGEQVEEQDARIRQWVAASNGEYTRTRVKGRAAGLTVEEYFTWLGDSFKAVVAGGPEVKYMNTLASVYPAHPEHYAVPDYPGVIETLGGYPTRTRVGSMPREEIPAFLEADIEESYPLRRIGTASLEDGTQFGWGLQQFRDTEDGFEMTLDIWWARAMPQIFHDDHAQHYSIEFRNFIQIASRDLASKAAN